MKLDYFDLLSPLPVHINNVGSIKCPTLLDISRISYLMYTLYTYMLGMSVEEYFERYPSEDVSDKVKMEFTNFDLVLINDDFAKSIEDAFNFFFAEHVTFVNSQELFVVTDENPEKADSNGNPLIVGLITRDSYSQVIDIIFQRLRMGRKTEELNLDDAVDESTRRRMEKLRKGRESLKRSKINSKSQGNKDLTLANVISSVAAYSPSVNHNAIWNMTVFQILDEFDRLRLIDQYNISSMSVAAWGDTKKQFQFGGWSKSVYDQ